MTVIRVLRGYVSAAHTSSGLTAAGNHDNRLTQSRRIGRRELKKRQFPRLNFNQRKAGFLILCGDFAWILLAFEERYGNSRSSHSDVVYGQDVAVRIDNRARTDP